ncbi:adenine deaminase [Guptibacillus algicola]|uniref:adenine deaminase n=1 Tax=Guptibacillus algicola TaxID=225844 RepID=UPI001CD68D2B|nr:adenine deaminase [Alkalihalobacillus algicola]MCA0988823.1 adenine deaminase [Alkalihalobacillus algicola]
MNLDQLVKRIHTASGKQPADIVIKHAKVLDVYNLRLITGDVAISDGKFAGIGEYNGRKTIDAKNKILVPSLIDAHVHIESAMVPPSQFARAVLPHGVTAVVTDPHEIGNVLGAEGISFMIEDSEQIPLDVFFMLPSCVPSTPFENAGAVLTAKELKSFYSHPRVLGLAEVMDFPSVRNAEPSMIQKLLDALQNDKKIDGHAAGLTSDALNVYKSAGINTDHECVNAEEALERIQRGMYVLIREGSVAKNLEQLLPAINTHNARRFMFCTDDKHLDDLISEGSVDHNVRLAIKHGIDPYLAIQMASLNVAECYGLNKGAIAPGLDADFLLLNDLEEFDIHHVYHGGKLVAENGITPFEPTPLPPHDIRNTVHVPELNKETLTITLENKYANVIEVIPNQIVTKHLKLKVETNTDHNFIPSEENDLIKLAVIERHHDTGNIGLGIVKGLGVQTGAIATTVGHDSHNVIVAGTNDDDIITAVNTLRDIGGGLVVVNDGDIVGELALPIAGLLSKKDYQTVNQGLLKLDSALEKVGAPNHFNPFLTLSFLSLPVIPELKLTDMGLFDVTTFKHISIEE